MSKVIASPERGAVFFYLISESERILKKKAIVI